MMRATPGSSVDGNRWAAFNQRWSSHIVNGEFVGTDREYITYQADYAKTANEPIRVYTDDGRIKTVPPKTLENIAALKGRAQYNAMVDAGILDKNSKYVGKDDDENWTYLSPAQQARQERFEDELRASDPELYKIYQAKGIDGYNAELRSRKLDAMVNQTKWENDLKDKHPDLYKIYKEKGPEAYNSEIQKRQDEYNKYKADFENTLKTSDPELYRLYKEQGPEAYNKEIDRLNAAQAEKARLDQEEYTAKVKTFNQLNAFDQNKYVEDAFQESTNPGISKAKIAGGTNVYKRDFSTGRDLMLTKSFDQLTRDQQAVVIDYFSRYPDAKSRIGNEFNTQLYQPIYKPVLGAVPFVGTALYWNDMSNVMRGVSAGTDVLSVIPGAAYAKTVMLIRMASQGAKEVKVLDTIRAVLKEQRTVYYNLNKSTGKAFDAYVNSANAYARDANALELAKAKQTSTAIQAEKNIQKARMDILNAQNTAPVTDGERITRAQRIEVYQYQITKAQNAVKEANQAVENARNAADASKAKLIKSADRMDEIKNDVNSRASSVRGKPIGSDMPMPETQRVKMSEETIQLVNDTINDIHHPIPANIKQIDKQIAQLTKKINKTTSVKRKADIALKLSNLLYRRSVAVASELQTRANKIIVANQDLKTLQKDLANLQEQHQAALKSKDLNANPGSYKEAINARINEIKAQRRAIAQLVKDYKESLKAYGDMEDLSRKYPNPDNMGGGGTATATRTKAPAPTKPSTYISSKGKIVRVGAAPSTGGFTRTSQAQRFDTSREPSEEHAVDAIGKSINGSDMGTFKGNDPIIRFKTGKQDRFGDNVVPFKANKPNKGTNLHTEPDKNQGISPDKFNADNPANQHQPKPQEKPFTQTASKTKVKVDQNKKYSKAPRKDEKEELKEEPKEISNPKGAVAWPQGQLHGKTVYHEIEYPYNKVNTTVGRAPRGAVVVSPKKTPKVNIRVTKPGKIPTRTIDMGIEDIQIKQTAPKRVSIRFKPDPHQRTHSDLRIGKPPSPFKSQKVGKIYHTRVNGGTLLSRHPVGKRRR